MQRKYETRIADLPDEIFISAWGVSDDGIYSTTVYFKSLPTDASVHTIRLAIRELHAIIDRSLDGQRRRDIFRTAQLRQLAIQL